MTRQEEFNNHWNRLTEDKPGLFSHADRSMAALFFDLGSTSVLERVRDAIKPFVASINPTS